MAKSILFSRVRHLLRSSHSARQLGLRPREIEQLASDPTRRQFLRTTLIGAGGLLAGCRLPATRRGTPAVPAALPPPPHRADDPVVILGGGAAGLVAAYTLRKAGVPFVIYEAAARVGGRIFTERGINNDGQFFERGAELVDTNHHTLIALAAELGLEIEDFSSEPGAKDYVAELHHIDGHTYTEAEFVRAAEPLLAQIAEANRAMFGGHKPDLTYRASHNDVFRRYDEMNMREFLDAQSADAWVKKALEIAYLCEYGRELHEQSALNLIAVIGTDPNHFSMFGESDESKRVVGGNDGIILKLRDAIAGDGSRNIRYRHQLIALRERTGGFQCTFATPGGLVETNAQQVICALPIPLLREVDGVGKLALSPAKQRAIAEFQIGTNSKVVNSFSRRVWREAAPGRPSFSGAIYANTEIQNFWESSRLQRGERGLITALLGGRIGLNTSGASIGRHVALIDQALSGAAAAYEDVGVVMNWSKMPFNRGSYTCMAPGQYGRWFGAAGEPEYNGRLQFAGEHASVEFTGFMNGAYETGIAAAEAALASSRLAAAT